MYSCLYGVFDGHYGSEYADFALQRITAEIVLGQLTGKQTDEEVKEVLRSIFKFILFCNMYLYYIFFQTSFCISGKRLLRFY